MNPHMQQQQQGPNMGGQMAPMGSGPSMQGSQMPMHSQSMSGHMGGKFYSTCFLTSVVINFLT
jgi:hypothetical protein